MLGHYVSPLDVVQRFHDLDLKPPLSLLLQSIKANLTYSKLPLELFSPFPVGEAKRPECKPSDCVAVHEQSCLNGTILFEQVPTSFSVPSSFGPGLSKIDYRTRMWNVEGITVFE